MILFTNSPAQQLKIIQARPRGLNEHKNKPLKIRVKWFTFGGENQKSQPKSQDFSTLLTLQIAKNQHKNSRILALLKSRLFFGL